MEPSDAVEKPLHQPAQLEATTKSPDNMTEHLSDAQGARQGGSGACEDGLKAHETMTENHLEQASDPDDSAPKLHTPDAQEKDATQVSTGNKSSDQEDAKVETDLVGHAAANEANEANEAKDPKIQKKSDQENEMDIDTKPTATESAHTTKDTTNKKEGDEQPSADADSKDAMEIDSKREQKFSDNQSLSDPSNQATLVKTSSGGTPQGEASPHDNKKDDMENGKSEDDQLAQDESLAKDTEDEERTPSRPRRTSKRNRYQTPTRSLRPRTSGRVQTTGSDPQPSTGQDSSPQKQNSSPELSSPKSSPTPNTGSRKQEPADNENTPIPTMEANGLVMRIDEAVFVTEDQLDEFKIARLKDKQVKPFEQLTFQDLRTYNRDQLRAYCYAYGMTRRKKTEMEADMARYLSYWNKGRDGFALHKYVPTSSRVIDRVEPNPSDNVKSVPSETTERAGAVTASISREGSATPTSTGKATPPVKQSSSRAATPSHSAGSAANSVRLNGSQGSGIPGGASQAGAQASYGNSQAMAATQVVTQRSTAGAGRSSKTIAPSPPLPRGFGTSFKQRVHARQAGAKFKAAYNGAGPAIVNIVENAAAYFEGKDSPEVILDQAKSYERYQFNVDMLNEIFDGVPEESEEADGDVEMTGTDANVDTDEAEATAAQSRLNVERFKKDVLKSVASRVAAGTREEQANELQILQEQFKEMEDKTKYTERTNMRLFQRLERAETKEQIEFVKREFETVHNIKFTEDNPRPLVRRKLDKSLPPLVMSDEKCRILRFKVS